MAYIKDGKVVHSQGWSLSWLLLTILNVIRLFILTIFTGESNDRHINQYRATKGGWGKGSGSGGGRGPNINTFAKPASVGCAGGGG